MSARAFAAIDDLRARYDAGNVLVVSHKTVLRLVFCQLLNIELRRYRECVDWPTGAVSVLELGPCHADRPLHRRRAAPYIPQPARDLVGEQDAGWGELEMWTSSTTSQPAVTARSTSRSRPTTGSTP